MKVKFLTLFYVSTFILTFNLSAQIPDFVPLNEQLPAPIRESPEYNHSDELYKGTGARDSVIKWWVNAQGFKTNLSSGHEMNGLIEVLGKQMPKGIDVAGSFSAVGGMDKKAFSLFPSKNGSAVGAANFGEGAIILVGHDGVFGASFEKRGAALQLLKNAVVACTVDKPVVVTAIQASDDQLMQLGKALETLPPLRMNGHNINQGDLYLIQGARRLDDAQIELILNRVRHGAVLLIADTFWANESNGDLTPLKQIREQAGLTYCSSTTNPAEDLVLTDYQVYTNVPYFVDHFNQLSVKTDILYILCQTLERTQEMLWRYNPNQAETLFTPLIYSMNLPYFDKNSPIRTKQEPLRALIARLQGRFLKTYHIPIAHPASKDWPGEVPTDAKRITRTLTINTMTPPRWGHTHGERPTWKMTGLYAIAGQSITVTIPEQEIPLGLQAQIGSHIDVNYGYHDNWHRFPDIVKTVDLKDSSTTFISSFGGLVFILVPPNTPSKDIRITIAGAVEAPIYVYGKTTLSQWEKHKNALGAWGYVQTPNTIVFAKGEHMRKIVDAERIASHWWNVMNGFDKINGMENLRQRPDMISSERQITVGYGHAGYPAVMCYDDDDVLVSERIIKDGDWGFYHELGHGMQAAVRRQNRLADHAEIDVNLFPFYAYEKIHGSLDPLHYCSPHSTANRDVQMKDWLLFSQTPIEERDYNRSKTIRSVQYLFYWELIRAFGWGVFERATKRIYLDLDNRNSPETKDLNHRERFLKLLSLESQHNLLPYYAEMGLLPYAKKLEKDPDIIGLPQWRWNRAPHPMMSQKIVIKENHIPNGAVAKFSTTDDDVANKVYYRIVQGNDLGSFEMNALTGELYLRKALDFEQDSHIKLVIEAFDTAFIPLKTSTTCEIEVTNEREAGVLKNGNYFWFKDLRSGDTLGVLDFVIDHCCTATFSASANDYISVDSQTGRISVKAIETNPRIKLPLFYELDVFMTQFRNGTPDAKIERKIRVFPETQRGIQMSRSKINLEKLPLEKQFELWRQKKGELMENQDVFQWKGDGHTSYFIQAYTLFKAPEKSSYCFYVAADDAAVLSFKRLKESEKMTPLCKLFSWVDPLDFTQHDMQKSNKIELEKGEIILLGLDYLQISGDAHFAVGVQQSDNGKIELLEQVSVPDIKMGFFLNP